MVDWVKIKCAIALLVVPLVRIVEELTKLMKSIAPVVLQSHYVHVSGELEPVRTSTSYNTDKGHLKIHA